MGAKLKTVKTKLKKIFSFRIGENIHTDWKFLLSIFVLTALVVIMWTGYIFWKIENGALWGGGEEINLLPPQTIDEGLLGKAAGVIESKKKVFENISWQKIPSDPSLEF
ncbi:MAG: hypothetical protein Q8P52_02325 [bacterium]|nr:hypothetical protein [bacterium]